MKRRAVFTLVSLLIAVASLPATDTSYGVTFGLLSGKTSTKIETSLGDIGYSYSSSNIYVSSYVEMGYLYFDGGFSFLHGLKRDNITLDPDLSVDVHVSLLGKYPINLGITTLAPMAGVEISKTIFSEDYDTSDSSMDVWIKGGVSADLKAGRRLYLRPTVLVAYRFLSDDEKNSIQFYKNAGGTASITPLRLDLLLSIGNKL